MSEIAKNKKLAGHFNNISIVSYAVCDQRANVHLGSEDTGSIWILHFNKMQYFRK